MMSSLGAICVPNLNPINIPDRTQNISYSCQGCITTYVMTVEYDENTGWISVSLTNGIMDVKDIDPTGGKNELGSLIVTCPGLNSFTTSAYTGITNLPNQLMQGFVPEDTTNYVLTGTMDLYISGVPMYNQTQYTQLSY